jgi:hypothetical protein
MPATVPTGVDKVLSLETVYYSAPIPRDLGVLTILGAVFDKVYFPAVYFPKGGYDQRELDKEIERIKALGSQSRDGSEIVAMLSFVKYAKVLDGFCEFTRDGENPFSERPISAEALEALYFAIHGPGSPGWKPFFPNNFHKMLPGSEEHITYPGAYHYVMNAVIEAGERGVPLIHDVPGSIPIPGYEAQTPHNDAKSLSAILAVECAKLALPEMPILLPEELMEFRAENVDALRKFRRSMLQHASALNTKIKDLSPDDFENATRFFVQTEIVPAMDELRAAINAPARPWYRRIGEFGTVTAQVGAGFVSMPPHSAIANALAKYAALFANELTAEGDHRAAMKRSGLYYLLSLERFHGSRSR